MAAMEVVRMSRTEEGDLAWLELRLENSAILITSLNWSLIHNVDKFVLL